MIKGFACEPSVTYPISTKLDRTGGHTMEVEVTSLAPLPLLNGLFVLGEIRVEVYIRVKKAHHVIFPRALLITKVNNINNNSTILTLLQNIINKNNIPLAEGFFLLVYHGV